MGIKYRPSGLVSLYGQLGQLAGEAQAREKAEIRRSEIRQRTLARAQELAWQKERMEIDRRWDIEAYNRSKQWELEKMEIASRLDFQNQEERRQRDSEELEAKKKAIRESQILGNKEKQLWITQLESGLPVATSAMRSAGSDNTLAVMLDEIRKETVPTPVVSAKGSLERSKYTIGQIINRGGKNWKVVGFASDGEPLVEETK